MRFDAAEIRDRVERAIERSRMGLLCKCPWTWNITGTALHSPRCPLGHPDLKEDKP